MKWKGMSDSRVESSKPKVGSLDRCKPAGSEKYQPTGSEAFGDKRGGKSMNWKGNKDNR